MKGTASQAIAFALRMSNEHGIRFLGKWAEPEVEVGHWLILDRAVPDTSREEPRRITFDLFCQENPDQTRALLAECAALFKEYSLHHMAKGKPDVEKAKRNKDMHDRIMESLP